MDRKLGKCFNFVVLEFPVPAAGRKAGKGDRVWHRQGHWPAGTVKSQRWL